jgi:uncharacterized protein YajQ (UPF0234 family)
LTAGRRIPNPCTGLTPGVRTVASAAGDRAGAGRTPLGAAELTEVAGVVADPSFDVVSKVDRQEVDNAMRQAGKELGSRFDFRGTGAEVSWNGELGVVIQADDESRCLAAVDVFKEKLIKRGISLKAFESDEPKLSGKIYKVNGTIIQGIAADKAKTIGKYIRDEGPKGVQAQIQGDQLRVVGKKKDQLQEVIALLKEHDFGIALQFTNYR